MATDKPASKWRNVAVWSAMGAVVYILAVTAGVSLKEADVPGMIFKSQGVTAGLAMGLIASALLVGFSRRNTPVSLRSLRNFVIGYAAAVFVAILALRGFDALAGAAAPGAMGASERIAAGLGLALVIFSILGILVVVAAYSRAGFLTAEQVEETRERSRATMYSWAAIAAMGLSLILLGLAGPGGALSPTIALVAVVVLLGIVTGLTFAMWPLLDELSQTMSRDTGNAAFYLIVIIGGGWAILAHLGFVQAPAPLDWLTMFTLIMFAASFMAIGRRGLLKSH